MTEPAAPILERVALSIAPFAAAVLAVASPAPAVAAEASPACDARTLVLPGEEPLGTPCAALPTSTDAAAPTVTAGGEILVTARPDIPGDPMVAVNAQAYKAVAKVDEVLVEPIADAYRDDLPKPVRKGLSNFFSNLREPVVFLNDLLQLRPGRAVKTVGRFAINSTAGVGGLFDVARKKFGMRKRSNGFANTLGYYGVGPGPFLMLPLLGATTVRDMLGGAADTMVLPNAVGAPFDKLAYRAGSYVVTSLDTRLEIDSEIERARASSDPYASTRDAYLARRKAEIDALKAPGYGAVEKPKR